MCFAESSIEILVSTLSVWAQSVYPIPGDILMDSHVLCLDSMIRRQNPSDSLDPVPLPRPPGTPAAGRLANVERTQELQLLKPDRLLNR